MTVETKMIEEKTYIAEDGTPFTNEHECKNYEDIMTLEPVFIIVAPHHSERSLLNSVFKTEEDAKEYMKRKRYDIGNGVYVMKTYINVGLIDRKDYRGQYS